MITILLTETILSETQYGFKKGCMVSHLDCIFTIAQIIEKHREYQLTIYIAFIDFRKAFDRVNRGSCSQ